MKKKNPTDARVGLFAGWGRCCWRQYAPQLTSAAVITAS